MESGVGRVLMCPGNAIAPASPAVAIWRAANVSLLDQLYEMICWLNSMSLNLSYLLSFLQMKQQQI